MFIPSSEPGRLFNIVSGGNQRLGDGRRSIVGSQPIAPLPLPVSASVPN